ncbi:MAG TPA: hypothetical protein VKB84_09040 [Candidatus Binataceae bacterium]|nr:hypothetical protein [Candidatus Binataceae bacterium]
MELRLLDNEADRAAFERALTEARATKGSGFMEKQRSRLGRVHLAFADLWAVFDEESSTPDRMLAGFAMHSLDLFSQSYPKPDLTHLPPEEVFEVGELWALSLGAGAAARHGGFIVLGLQGATSLLIYPIAKPWDLTGGYPDYRAVDAPIQWPFAETLDGDKIYVQPMILDGENLRRRISSAAAAGYEVRDDNRLIRFENPLAAAILERRLARMRRAAGLGGHRLTLPAAEAVCGK